MSDLIDAANDSAELFRRASLSKRKAEVLPKCGECLNCGAITVGRWCDTHCRDDWDKRKAAQVNAVTPDAEASA